MKLAVTVANEGALESAFVVWRGFEESIRKASEYGYDGVELALKNAHEYDWNELHRILDRYHMQVSCITTGQVFSNEGLYFTHPDPAKRKQIVETYGELLKLAKEFDCMVNTGRTRGFIPEGGTWEQTEKLFLECMNQVCDKAEALGRTVILEPICKEQTNFINRLDQGVTLLKKLGRSCVGLQPDVYHMDLEEKDITESFAENRDWVKYVHFADTDRKAPGDGDIDWDMVLAALKKIDYNGWASVEILPIPDPDTAARASIDYLRPKIEAYNRG